MSAGSLPPASINVRVARLVVDRQVTPGADHRGLKDALPTRIADRIGGTPPGPLQPQPCLVDAIADAVGAAVDAHIATRRGRT